LISKADSTEQADNVTDNDWRAIKARIMARVGRGPVA